MSENLDMGHGTNCRCSECNKRNVLLARAKLPPHTGKGACSTCATLREEVERLRLQAEQHHRLHRDETWHWQDDGEDVPESLGCPVIVNPDIVRRWVKAEAERDEAIANARRLKLAADEVERRGEEIAALKARCEELEAMRDILPLRLAIAWGKYLKLFGEAPHGTHKQLAALVEFLPDANPEQDRETE